MKRRMVICWFMTMLLLGGYFAVESKGQAPFCYTAANGMPSGCSCNFDGPCAIFGWNKWCCVTYCIGGNVFNPYDGLCRNIGNTC